MSIVSFLICCYIFFNRTEIVLNCIYYYSYAQILFKKCFINNNNNNNSKNNNFLVIEHIHKDNSTNTIFKASLDNVSRLDNVTLDNYSFNICKYVEAGYEYIRLNYSDDCIIPFVIFHYPFINMTIVVNDLEYQIYLKTDRYSYYIESNLFNKTFFSYYMKHNYSIDLDENIVYMLKIIDSDCNMKTIKLNKKEDGILLFKNTYSIIETKESELELEPKLEPEPSEPKETSESNEFEVLSD